MVEHQIPRSAYSRFFFKKHLRLIQAFLNRNEHRPNYDDIDVVDEIVAPYRALLKEPLPKKPDDTPKHIWLLWQQGWEHAPPLVKACAKSWQDLNPGWEVHLLDEKSLLDFAPDYAGIKAQKISRAAQSDVARLCLLKENGGVWADATILCHQPLDAWLPKVMEQGFFMFADPRPYRYSEIWFLASAKNTYLMETWFNLVCDYWRHFSRPHHYYWMAYLFEFLALRDEKIAHLWRRVPKLSANGPHIVQAHRFNATPPNSSLSVVEQGVLPLHKLSHKWRFSGSLKGTPVGLLTGLDRLQGNIKDAS